MSVIAQEKKVLVAWSSGKDAAWALHELRRQSGLRVAGLLTTVNARFERVAMHGVRRALLRQQAEAANVPLWEVDLPHPCDNAAYAEAMAVAMARAVREGITAVAFGDVFLEDVRRYRERMLATTGLEPLFPLWGRPTRELVERMLEAGLRARITCVDPRVLPAGLAGCELDASFLSELPAGVDPCGENGEFHSFVWSGPMLARPVAVRVGEIVERDGFVFADLLPGEVQR